MASWILASGFKKTTKQPKDGFVEPGWELAIQPNKPIIDISSLLLIHDPFISLIKFFGYCG
jgi:hypothetical protein